MQFVSLRTVVGAAAVLVFHFFGALAFQAAAACGDTEETIVVTCQERLSGAQQDFLQHRLSRMAASAPEEDQISGRLDGRLWDPKASGTSPLVLAPADGAANVQTSLSRWSAYYSQQDAKQIEEVKPFAPADLKLPSPVAAHNRKLDVWTSTKVEGLNGDASQQGYASHIGADYAVSSGLLLGASVQFEDLEQRSANGTGLTAGGTGYLIGPYLAKRLTDNLTFDTRLAWGRSHGAVDGEGIASGFVTERGLAEARLKGKFHLQDWRFGVSAALTYASEVPADGLGSAVVTNNFSLEPEMRRTFHLEDGVAVEPFVRYRSTVDLNASTLPSELDELAVGGSLGGGVSVTSKDEYTIKATTEFEGVGTQSDPAMTSKVQVAVPLN